MELKITSTTRTITSSNDKYSIEATVVSDLVREKVRIESGVVRAEVAEDDVAMVAPMNHIANFSHDFDRQFNFNFYVATPAERAEILALIEEFIAAVEEKATANA
jgi:hypothetical protein